MYKWGILNTRMHSYDRELNNGCVIDALTRDTGHYFSSISRTRGRNISTYERGTSSSPLDKGSRSRMAIINWRPTRPSESENALFESPPHQKLERQSLPKELSMRERHVSTQIWPRRKPVPSVSTHRQKVPPNPHFALQHPSETANTESELSPYPPEDKSLQYQLLACDQPSFVTGSASADLQASHIIKVVNTNHLRKQELVSIFVLIMFGNIQEDYLSQQRLQEPSRLRFLLDSPTNAILREHTTASNFVTSINWISLSSWSQSPCIVGSLWNILHCTIWKWRRCNAQCIKQYQW